MNGSEVVLDWTPARLDRSKPKYLALADLIESEVALGALRDGDRLPAQREIARSLDITIGTITKAIREAVQRGVVTARTGSGTFIRVNATAPEPRLPGPDLSLNVVPGHPCRPFVEAALAELAKRKAVEDLYRYETAAGSAAQRRLFSRWLGTRGLEAEADRVLLTHGGQHGLAACFAALTRPGDTVLCEQWAYTGIRRLADINHVGLEGVRLDREGMTPQSLQQRLAETGATVVICSAVMQNPTTATMSLERRRQIVELCERAGAVLVEDDIYGHLSGEPHPPMAALGRNVIHVASLSKCIGPGARLGTLAAPEALVPALANALVAWHWTAPVWWAALFEVMFTSGAFETCLAAHRSEIGRRNELYATVVGERPHATLPTYHVWQAIPPAWRPEDFVAELAADGVRVSPAHHFAVGSETEQPGHVRVCLGGGDLDQLRHQLVKFRNVLSAPLPGTTIS